jgi:NAD dependent epimerase/dehydratase
MSKKCLVTGADGFIGSHLVETLLDKGYEVLALAQYNSFGSWGWLDQIDENDRLKVVTGDIRDPFFCRTIVKDIDVVFHLAALIGIPYSYVAPETYVATNITGTLNICQACLDEGVQKLIHTSTSEVYGSAKYVPIDEKHPIQPQSPYSASKIGADAMAMSFYNSFELPLVVARPFNTFGPRQSARAIIPTIISQIHSGAKLIKLGDVTPTRDFNYVKDTCNGFILLSEENAAIGEAINIGSNSEYSILETFKLIKKHMNSDVQFEADEIRFRPSNSEVTRLVCDNSKIRNFGYESQFSFEDGLIETIKWLTNEENFKKYKTNLYNV